MRYLSNKPLFVSGIAALLLVATLAVSTVRTVQADANTSKSGERLLVVHDGSTKQGFLTRSATVREALEGANIPLDNSDLVEPSLDEELVASSYDINIYRARPVTVVDGAVRKKIMSAYRTPAQIAKHADMELRSEDKAELSLPADTVRSGAGVQLTIQRATSFTLILYGKKTIAYSQAKTVAAMLKEKKITIGKDDTLSVDTEAQLTEGMTVELWRNGTQTVTEEREVPFGTERINDVDRELGYREVKTVGVPGKRTVTYEIEMKNGQELSRKEIQSVVTKEPVKQVEIVGAKMTNTFSGSFAEALARLRSCEGSYTSNTGNGYYGAYQFDIGTWGGYQGYPNAAVAPPAVQDQKAWETYQRRGWQPWPSCTRKMGLQDIYR